MFEHFPLAKNWPNYDTAMTIFRYAIVRELCRGKKVLEIGAASGEGTALFADVAKDVVALDHQNIWEGSPASKIANVRFICEDALSMPAEWSGYFDVVIAMELIEHLDAFSNFQKSVFNVLSENGVFVLSTPNFDIYSDKGDSLHKPLYVHHRREYRAEELKSSFLDCWKSKRIMGLSQLSFPRIISQAGDSEVLLYFGEATYQLKLGVSYPEFKIFKGASLPHSLPLEFCQSFIAILCKGAPPEMEHILREFDNNETISTTVEETAFHSGRVILQRRNEQCASMGKIIENMKAHIENLENIVKDREGQIGDLQRLILETKKAVDDAMGKLAAITQLRRRLPFRMAEKITGKKLIAIPELDKAP